MTERLLLLTTDQVIDAMQRWLAIKHPELVGRVCRFKPCPEGMVIEVVEEKYPCLSG